MPHGAGKVAASGEDKAVLRHASRNLTRLAAVSALGLATAAPLPAAAQSAQSDRAIAAQVDAVLSRMTLPHKIAQLIEPDISTITPEDMRTYRFGSFLNGANSGPGGDLRAKPEKWLALADAMWAASSAPLPDGEPAVPTLWATDAVHGHGHLGGATIFPHNIGLGAAGDAALVRRIGAAVASEIAVTGIDWTFAPTLAVVGDVRWGRSYESFGSDPASVARLGAAMVEGLQGEKGTAGFLDQHHVLATMKHFLGDGGTGGKDEGDTRGDLATLIATHAPPYRAAIAADGQTVMASFSSVNGEKMHGNKALLTGLLRDQLGFGGLVVGDWNAQGQLPGCTNRDCPQALNAGLDIYMVPEDWRGLIDSLRREVSDGTIPMARVDEAVRRVLTVKARYGLFAKPRPSARALAGQWSLLGSAEHRDLAREAVARSLVLLRNAGVLPIRASANILVAGSAADSVARQSGGWTINWQGGADFPNSDFPGATSIYAGIAAAARAGGGSAVLSRDGSYGRRPDVAVVVYGEKPYAEYAGDIPDLALRDDEGLRLLRHFRAEHIPTVAVLLSGRPLWAAREMAEADAFVAAWLPGSEGEGLADVLIGDAAGHPRRDFTGRLPFAWPASCASGGASLFAVGEGGSYARPPQNRAGTIECATFAPTHPGTATLFDRFLAAGANASATDSTGSRDLPRFTGASTDRSLEVVAFDAATQEDARRVVWHRPATLGLQFAPAALPPAGGVLHLDVRLAAAPRAPLVLSADCAGCTASVDLAPTLSALAGKGWATLDVPLACLAPGGPGAVRLRSAAPLELEVRQIAAIARAPNAATARCNGPFAPPQPD